MVINQFTKISMSNKKGNKRKLLTISFFTVSVLFIASFVFTSLNYTINITSSLPLGIYKTKSINSIKQSDIILFCLDPMLSEKIADKKVLTQGSCPFNLAKIGKKVVAVPNDTVTINQDGIKVNGKSIANSRVNLDVVATLEIPLIEYEGVLRSHEYVVASEKDNSFDSRYFGIVTEDMIIGSLHPVLTISPAK